MANPQLENGYIRIATGIWQQLRQLKISPLERCILDFILEKTYGFNKKNDWISLSQFGAACEVTTSKVCRGINKLKDKNIIHKENGKYIFNKDFETWVLPKQAVPKKVVPILVLPKKDIGVLPKKDIGVLPKKGDTIDSITINNITKDNPPPEKKKIDGHQYRGENQYFDVFLDYCAFRGISPSVIPSRYVELRGEFDKKVIYWNEIKACLDWLYDRGLKVVNIQRLRNWLRNAVKFQKEKEIKLQQQYSDKKNLIKSQIIKPNLPPLWTAPL